MDKMEAELLDIAKECKQVQRELCTVQLEWMVLEGAGPIVNKETTHKGDSK